MSLGIEEVLVLLKANTKKKDSILPITMLSENKQEMNLSVSKSSDINQCSRGNKMVSRRKRHRAGRQFYWQKGEEGVSGPQLRLLLDENLQKIISGGKIREDLCDHFMLSR